MYRSCLTTRVGLLLAALLLAGCGTTDKLKSYLPFTSSKDNSPVPTELYEFERLLTLDALWSTRIGDGVEGHYLQLAPAFAEGNVFVASSDGVVQALQADTGKSLWRLNTRLPFSGGPFADTELVLLGTREAQVLALHPEDGTELWRARVSSEVLSAPQHSGSHVVVRTVDGNVSCLDAETGESLWVQPQTIPALTLRGNSDPLILGDRVVVGYGGGRLAALNLDSGVELWDIEIYSRGGASELEQLVDIDAKPVIVGGIIYIAGFQGEVVALELDSGRPIWKRDISAYTDLAVDENRLYVSDEESKVWALDRFTGDTIWEQDNLRWRAVTGPAVIGDMVVVGDMEGYLHGLDRYSGEFAERIRVSDAPMLVPAAVFDNTLYAYASDGSFSAWVQAGQQVPSDATGDVEDGVVSAIEDTEDTGDTGDAGDTVAPATNAGE